MSDVYLIVDKNDQQVAQLIIDEIAEGWYYGTIVCESFSIGIKNALERYDEVVSGQMLSLLDEAFSAVEQLDLHIHLPDGSIEKAFSTHVMRTGDVAFRITPVQQPG